MLPLSVPYLEMRGMVKGGSRVASLLAVPKQLLSTLQSSTHPEGIKNLSVAYCCMPLSKHRDLCAMRMVALCRWRGAAG